LEREGSPHSQYNGRRWKRRCSARRLSLSLKVEERPGEETAADFNAKKGIRCKVKPGFGDPKAYSIIPSDETDQYFATGKDKKAKDGWTAFYEKHPHAGGFWQFSRPAYNLAGDEALVYVSHSCGWLCGTGHLYLLRRDGGHWKVNNRLMLWIS
jgi:hypothetical protein